MSGTTSSATIAIHELRAAAAYCFPLEVQERLALLQIKNNEGTLPEAAAADPLLQLVGSFASPVTDVSDRHDAYLGQSLMEELRGSEHG